MTQQDLLTRLAPGLKELERGSYVRGYRSKKGTVRSSTHQLVADLLDSLKVPYKKDVPIAGSPKLKADFFANGKWIFVERSLSKGELNALARVKGNIVTIERERKMSDRFDHGIRVLGLGEEGGLQTIFLDDPSFSFDYAHILPKTRKCSVMHGHTSSVLVEIIGHPFDGMVVDFGIAKDIVREAVRSLDHKLFIKEDYVTKMDDKSVGLRFMTVHGQFAIQAPRGTTVLLKGEATVENLAQEVLQRISPSMPGNVTAVGVYVYEGLNKGSHILAQIHQGGSKQRKKQ